MIRTNPIWRSAAVLGVLGLALTACGGGSDTATQPTKSDKPSSAAPAGKGDGELVVGTLLPQTGSLAFLGPPEFAGVDLAVKDINAAGGVLGKPIKKFNSDSGDDTTQTASQSVDRLLPNKIDAVIGAASSSVSLQVIDKITGNGVLQISPANTSDAFTTYKDKGLYFRTAPPDVLQGRVLGDLTVADGNATVGLLVRQDSYGTGLAKQVRKAIEGGGGQVVKEVVYDTKTSSFGAQVGQLKAEDPDAIVVIAFDEVKKIIPEMVQQGIGPKTKKVYFVDGDIGDYSKDFDKGTLTGVKATQPGVVASSEFQTRLKSIDPKLTVYNYGPESYDATILVALAATAAKDDAGTSIATKMQDVSAGGEKCTSFQDCVALLKDGKDIDYDGVSGPIEFNDAGDPSQATMGIYQYDATNTFKFVEGKPGKI